MKRFALHCTLASLFAIAPLGAAQAQSATYACPAVKDIVAKPGVEYRAPAANGKTWTGEDPMAPDDIQVNAGNTTFKGGYVGASKTLVMCEYEHTAAGAATQIRLSLDLPKPVDTTGDQWKSISTANGPVTQRCAGQDPARCTFH